jgi:hypothetical protein
MIFDTVSVEQCDSIILDTLGKAVEEWSETVRIGADV